MNSKMGRVALEVEYLAESEMELAKVEEEHCLLQAVTLAWKLIPV
jgi:hypothetical protein